MYTLTVSVNQEPAITAGGDTLHTLNAMLTCRINPEIEEAEAARFSLTVGGMTLPVPGVDGMHLRWIDEMKLQLGDVVTFSLSDSIPPHPPAPSPPAATREQSERFIFENCKRTYLALRDRYDIPTPAAQ